jgi:hypothetical protein
MSDVRVTVYYIAGRQLGPLSIPSSWCRECDVTMRLVEDVAATLRPQAEIQVDAKPWLPHLFTALRRGGWHPPVVLVNDKLLSRGVVPDRDKLHQRLRLAASER